MDNHDTHYYAACCRRVSPTAVVGNKTDGHSLKIAAKRKTQTTHRLLQSQCETLSRHRISFVRVGSQLPTASINNWLFFIRQTFQAAVRQLSNVASLPPDWLKKNAFLPITSRPIIVGRFINKTSARANRRDERTKRDSLNEQRNN